MTFLQMQQEVARNLNLLSSDDTTIITGSNVTQVGIQNKLNSLYQDKFGQWLIRKYPQDDEQVTYPLYMYRQSFIVSASSTGTTLISTTPIFANGDEGFQIAFVDGVFGTAPLGTLQIQTFVSTTQVTLFNDIPSDYIGTTGYILGNEFTLNGDASVIKEIISVETKYQYPVSSWVEWQFAELRRKTDLPNIDSNAFSSAAPIYYLTSDLESGQTLRAFGILPFPTDYRGQVRITITKRFDAMVNPTDVPRLENIGVSEPLINGTTAWGWRVLGDIEKSNIYESVYQRDMVDITRNYRPVNRAHSSKIRMSNYYERLNNKLS